MRDLARALALAPVVLGVALAMLAPRPDMLVAADGATVAMRGADGLLHFLRKPRDKFVAREWLRRDGDSRDIAQAVGFQGLNCDGLGCVVTRGAVIIAASTRAEALDDDCVMAAVVISTGDGPCHGPALVLTERQIQAGQGWRVWLSSPLHAESVRDWRGDRPWVVADGE